MTDRNKMYGDRLRLREMARAAVDGEPPDLKNLTHRDVETLVRELNLCLVELDSRNAELAAACLALEEVLDRFRELQKRRRSLPELLSDLGHEIRTPMTIFMGALEHLLEIDPSAERRQLLELADESAQSLSTLIDDILDVSRIEARRMVLEEEPFDLPELVRSAVKTMAPRARERNLRLEAEVAPRIPLRVFGDARRLSQILVRLIGHAIDSAREERVRVSVRPQGGGLEFSVSDTPTESALRRAGVQLEMAICKGLIELMGGKLGTGGREEEGRAFTFTLPLRHADEGSV